jgi:hypothetical protein
MRYSRIAAEATLSGLGDVVITEPATQYQHLEYTGSQW